MIGEIAIKYKFLEMALDYLVDAVFINLIQKPKLDNLKSGDRIRIIRYRDPEYPDDDEDYYNCTILKVYHKRGLEHIAFSFDDGIAVGLETRLAEFIK